MKNLGFFIAMLCSSFCFGKGATFACVAVESKSALVAGPRFKLTVDDEVGINGNYTYPVRIESTFLGNCDGVALENQNPLAEGYAGAVSVGGSKCAADDSWRRLTPAFCARSATGRRGWSRAGGGARTSGCCTRVTITKRPTRPPQHQRSRQSSRVLRSAVRHAARVASRLAAVCAALRNHR